MLAQKGQTQEIQKPPAKRQKTDIAVISSKKERKQKVTHTQPLEKLPSDLPSFGSIEKNEEREMRRLEKKLKIKSSAKLSKSFKDDGLYGMANLIL